ncbi:hypothetical protein DFS34DRAFT_644170 [Phlyctochytrium arcticum]|nr:hypothetical protein DFS34DRAFT_644170 [Phlyctochytrium arcticum]
MQSIDTEWGRSGPNAIIVPNANIVKAAPIPPRLLITTPNGLNYDKRTMEKLDYPAGKPVDTVAHSFDILQPPIITAPPKVSLVQQATREFFAEKAELEAISLQSENIQGQKLTAPRFGAIPQQGGKIFRKDPPPSNGLAGLNGLYLASDHPRSGSAGKVDISIKDTGKYYVQRNPNLTDKSVWRSSHFLQDKPARPMRPLKLEEDIPVKFRADTKGGPSLGEQVHSVAQRVSQPNTVGIKHDKVKGRKGKEPLLVAEPINRTPSRLPTGTEQARFKGKKPAGLRIDVNSQRTPGVAGDRYPHVDFAQSQKEQRRLESMRHSLNNFNREYPPVDGEYFPDLPFRGDLLPPKRGNRRKPN